MRSTGFGNAQARFHRLTFVLGTVGLAIAGSRVANDVGEVGSWLLTTASILIIATSDVGQELATNAKQLAMKSGTSYTQSLEAIVQRDAPRWLAVAMVLAILLLASSGAAYALQGESENTERSRPTETPSRHETPSPPRSQMPSTGATGQKDPR